MPPGARHVFPLVPRRRIAGLPFGAARSVRRGAGSDIAGSRVYVRGDPVSTIDWRASARLSSARGRDEFIVRERIADEATRVVVLRDASSSMALYAPPLPWLSKPAAASSAVELIGLSARAARTSIAYLDLADGAQGAPHWIAPRGAATLERILRRERTLRPSARSGSLASGLRALGQKRSELSSGTFVFVISDFLDGSLSHASLAAVLTHGWEIVPVVIQDPVWERSFPPVGPLVLPLVEPDGSARHDVHLSRSECRRLRSEHESRYADLLGHFNGLGLDTVTIATSDDEGVEAAFQEWARRRTALRRRR